MVKFETLPNEELEDYILRLYDSKKKDSSLTWQMIADAIEVQFGVIRSESWVRKKANCIASKFNQSMDETFEKNAILDKILELKKERIKLQDERSQNNAYVRKLAREETIKEIAYSVAKEMGDKKFLNTHNNIDRIASEEECEAILCISDWHYGLDFKNPWNEFSPDICKQRINNLKEKAIHYIKRHKCKKIHLTNLGDLIAGRIHLTIRLESRFDVITQTLHISEILAEFISDLSKYADIDYYDCIDNHSRLEPDKKASQDLESLARIIPWYLKERLKNNSRVVVKENKFGHDLITFECMGFKIVASHGHQDLIKNIDHLSMMTEQHYDMFLTAHEHHFQADEKNRCIAIGNGTLMGVDSYSQKLRLSSTPSQNLIITTKENVAECIYRILV